MNPTDDNDTSEMTLVGSFQKNQQEAVCAGVNEWHGKNYLFLRIFAPVLGTEDLVPTKKGISLEYQHIDDLLDGVKKLGEVMGGDQIVKRIPKNDTQEIQIGTSTYMGQSLLNVRLYTKYKGEDVFQPTQKGVSIQSSQYPLLLEVVEKLHKHIKSVEK